MSGSLRPGGFLRYAVDRAVRATLTQGACASDGSPEHVRHGVGGFPKVTEQPSRTSRPSGGRFLVVVPSGAILLAVVVVVAGFLL